MEGKGRGGTSFVPKYLGLEQPLRETASSALPWRRADKTFRRRFAVCDVHQAIAGCWLQSPV